MSRHAPPETWFSDRRLAFHCTKCGACCRRPGWVFVQPNEAVRIAKRLLGPNGTPRQLAGELWVRGDDGDWQIEVEDGGACPLLGEEGCTVHDIKPMQCATYPFWPEILATEADWIAEAFWCEGLRERSPEYSAEQVFDLLAECSRTRESDPER
ncbi:MAG: YkgJ family cysteine cluster protein [Deltaproteobacteria bacterium]|nr:MAG: YkgJ family cysteine cluster protein [Deltaproteobacteria bacterium]